MCKVLLKRESKPPEWCSDCTCLWRDGVKDGSHNRWCCKFGRPTERAWKHCKNTSAKPTQEVRNG